MSSQLCSVGCPVIQLPLFHGNAALVFQWIIDLFVFHLFFLRIIILFTMWKLPIITVSL